MNDRIAASMEKVIVTAMLSGHEIVKWNRLKTGQEAACQRCGRRVAIWNNGMITSFLGPSCSDQAAEKNLDQET